MIDVTGFLSCEENQCTRNLAITVNELDFMNTHQILNPGGVLPVEQLIFGLKNLETLYVLGGVLSQEVGEAEVELVKVQEVEYSNETVIGTACFRSPHPG
jgi:hypothetical protein